MQTAYSYWRFSHKRQGKGASIPRQAESFRRHCEAKGYAPDESLRPDKGISAFRGKNATKGALGEFLKLAEAGKLPPGCVLVVESLDRLSRQQVITALHLFLQILDAGVQIDTIGDGYSYTTESVNSNPFDLMYSIMIMSRAHEESAIKSERVKDKMERKRQAVRSEGKILTKKCPAWIEWNEDRNRFQLKKQEAATIRRIVKMATEGCGAPTICKTFNREGVPRIGRAKRWEYSNIRYYVNTRTLIGEYQPCKMIDGKPVPEGEPIQGYYPKVITENQWYKLQAALDTRRSGARGRQGDEGPTNLFGPVLTSGQDGSTFYLSQKRKENLNLLSGDKIKGLSETISFPYRPFEYHFLHWVKEVQLEQIKAEETGEVEVIRGQLVELQKKISQVEEQLEAADAGAAMGRLMKLLSTFESQEEQLKGELEKAKAAQQKPNLNGHDIGKLLAQIEGEEKAQVREGLRLAISTVVKQIKLYNYSPNRVKRLGIAEVTLADGGKRIFCLRVERNKEPFSFGLPIPVSNNFAFDKLAEHLLELSLDPDTFDAAAVVKAFMGSSKQKQKRKKKAA